jgi:hypothetical protein
MDNRPLEYLLQVHPCVLSPPAATTAIYGIGIGLLGHDCQTLANGQRALTTGNQNDTRARTEATSSISSDERASHQHHYSLSFADESEPADLYQEDKCNVGPRVLKTVVKLSNCFCDQESQLTDSSSNSLMEAIILFNKGLVCHSK